MAQYKAESPALKRIVSPYVDLELPVNVAHVESHHSDVCQIELPIVTNPILTIGIRTMETHKVHVCEMSQGKMGGIVLHSTTRTYTHTLVRAEGKVT